MPLGAWLKHEGAPLPCRVRGLFSYPRLPDVRRIKECESGLHAVHAATHESSLNPSEHSAQKC
jgi:hypothetical protein